MTNFQWLIFGLVVLIISFLISKRPTWFANDSVVLALD
jgi:hypothetical protein